MEFLDSPAAWLILLIVLLVIEVLTLGLTTIWFAGGALAALIASLAGAGFWLQVLLFLLVSVVLLIFTRPVAVRYLNGRTTATNVDSLIGRECIVTEEINNLCGKGAVSVGGVTWTARAEREDRVIGKDRIVQIVRVDGVKAIVREKGE